MFHLSVIINCKSQLPKEIKYLLGIFLFFCSIIYSNREVGAHIHMIISTSSCQAVKAALPGLLLGQPCSEVGVCPCPAVTVWSHLAVGKSQMVFRLFEIVRSPILTRISRLCFCEESVSLHICSCFLSRFACCSSALLFRYDLPPVLSYTS